MSACCILHFYHVHGDPILMVTQSDKCAGKIREKQIRELEKQLGNGNICQGSSHSKPCVKQSHVKDQLLNFWLSSAACTVHDSSTMNVLQFWYTLPNLSPFKLEWVLSKILEIPPFSANSANSANFKLNAKLRLEFQVEYRFKLEFQVE